MQQLPSTAPSSFSELPLCSLLPFSARRTTELPSHKPPGDTHVLTAYPTRFPYMKIPHASWEHPSGPPVLLQLPEGVERMHAPEQAVLERVLQPSGHLQSLPLVLQQLVV